MQKEYKRLFHNPSYRRLLLAGLVNRFGDSVDALAMTWLMYQVSQSASLTALNFGLNFLPTVLLQPFCGAYVERRELKRIMVVSDLMRAAIIGAVGVLALTGQTRSWMILLSTLLISTVEAFRVPSQAAVIPLLLEPEDYSAGQSLSSSLGSVVQLIGTALAGAIVAAFGVGAGILIDTGCFLLSAALLAGMRPRRRDTALAEGLRVWRDTLEGLRYVRGSGIMRVIAGVAILINALVVPFSALEAAMCSELFQKGPEVISVIGVGITLGNIVGGGLFPAVEKRMRFSSLLLLCFGGVALFYGSCLLAGRVGDNGMAFYLIISVVPFFLGIAIAWINIFASVLMLRIVDEDYLSRANAIMGALCAAGTPVASFAVSLLAARFSVAAIFAGTAALTLLGGIGVFRSHTLRDYEKTLRAVPIDAAPAD